jgi:photosystem II stability/assembly factor-like uncharacterized protein
MKPFFYLLLCLCLSGHLAAQWAVFTPDIPDTIGISHVHTVSAEVAWAVGIQYEVFPTGFDIAGLDKGYFFRTMDGGNSWSHGEVPMGGVPFLSNIHAYDANTAWVSGLDLVSGANKIFKTTDGGATWAEQTSTAFTDFASWVNFVYFKDATNGLCMSDATPSPDEETPHFEIYRTSDGGQQWVRIPAAQLPEPLAEDEYGVSGGYDAIGDHLWFGTSYGRVIFTQDGGDSWQVSESGLDYVLYLSFADTLNGIAATPPLAISLTEDGGHTWTDITPEWPLTFPTSAAMIPGSQYILLVTADDFVNGPFTTHISPDKGATWIEIGSGEEAGWANFISPAAGFAGEWQPADHKTRLYAYNGDPLSGLLSGRPLEIETALFPNPVQDVLTVAVTDSDPAEYLLLLNDLQGRLMSRQKLQASGDWTTRFDLSALPAGSYVLTIASAQGAVSRVVVKQ